MINKNYPDRHRLLVKEPDGTKIDQKPYVGRWKTAIDAWGLSFPGTVLFATKVLLVEGDSDPILINSTLQKLIELGKTSIDINPLSIMGTGDWKNADAIVRFLQESALRPQVVALFDGDQGGKERHEALKDLFKLYEIQCWSLPKNTTTEDNLILSYPMYLRAVSNYVGKLPNKEGVDIFDELHERFIKNFGEIKSDQIQGIAKWCGQMSKELAGLTEAPSKVGVAREYGLLLSETPEAQLKDRSATKRAESLARDLAKYLELAQQILPQESILQ